MGNENHFRTQEQLPLARQKLSAGKHIFQPFTYQLIHMQNALAKAAFITMAITQNKPSVKRIF
jgi:hypothetical protein